MVDYAGVADLDHNGLADILWRNVVTGAVQFGGAAAR